MDPWNSPLSHPGPGSRGFARVIGIRIGQIFVVVAGVVAGLALSGCGGRAAQCDSLIQEVNSRQSAAVAAERQADDKMDQYTQGSVSWDEAWSSQQRAQRLRREVSSAISDVQEECGVDGLREVLGQNG